jgi:hypothetical protein
MSREQEGWDVRARPAVIGMTIFFALLLTGLLGAGTYYRRHVAPDVRPELHAFPAPQLETLYSAPTDRRPPGPSAPPAGIDRAMAATAARGDTLWADR